MNKEHGLTARSEQERKLTQLSEQKHVINNVSSVIAADHAMEHFRNLCEEPDLLFFKLTT